MLNNLLFSFLLVHKATIPLETTQDIVLQRIGEVQMLLMYTMRLQKEPAKRLECGLLTHLISWESYRDDILC